MELDLRDEAFRAAAEGWLTTLGPEVIGDFGLVMSVSPGYYPTTLYTLWLAELVRRGVRADVTVAHGQPTASMPIAHPLDADWRFTPGTAGSLLDRAVRELAPGDSVIHLGCPSTFVMGVNDHPAIQHVLVEGAEPIVASLRRSGHEPASLLQLRIGQAKIPRLGARAAILDPPWYPADATAFLAAAATACDMRALILLCQPTVATRPAVEAERRELEASLPALGLVVEAIHRADLRYMTPHFEAMSLRTANPGIPDLPAWRVGDLLVLRKITDCADRPQAPTPPAGWADLRLGPVRIKIRHKPTAAHDLASLVPGDVLGTVSRRDPTRERVGLWTSGNRVFGVANPDRIARLVRLCADDLEERRFLSRRTLDHAEDLGVARSTASQLFDLLLIELQEHTAFEGA